MGKKINLEQLQSIYYDRFEKLHNFFVANNINYFAIGGTLLGAVRHKGFIPWDDDMDIGMLREDYEKFLSIANHLDKKYFKVINIQTEKHVEHLMTKIGLVGVINKNDLYNKKIDKHSHIDIFPMDFLPTKKGIKRVIRYKEELYYKYRNINKVPLSKKIPLILVKAFLLIKSSKYINKKFEKVMLKNNSNKNLVWASSGIYAQEKETHKIEYVRKTVLLDFGPIKISCPTNYHGFLVETYGENYMVPLKTHELYIEGEIDEEYSE